VTAAGIPPVRHFGYVCGMRRRILLLAPLALLPLARPARADKLPLAELSAYINGIKTATADFTQVNADGSVSTGKLWLRRPNRMRFEYAPPDRNLVLASAGSVAIFDARSNQPPEQYPLRRTPLHLILGNRVDLGRARMVVGHGTSGADTVVRAQDPEHPEYGRIDLIFAPDPILLKSWIITDDSGSQTTVILERMQTGVDLGRVNFDIGTEAERRNP
jgi:outer membrane lipoprotein-sorting protein